MHSAWYSLTAQHQRCTTSSDQNSTTKYHIPLFNHKPNGVRPCRTNSISGAQHTYRPLKTYQCAYLTQLKRQQYTNLIGDTKRRRFDSKTLKSVFARILCNLFVLNCLNHDVDSCFPHHRLGSSFLLLNTARQLYHR